MATVTRLAVVKEPESMAVGSSSRADRDATAELLTAVRRELAEFRERAERDRFTNPIQLMAASLTTRLAAGTLDSAGLEELLRRLTLAAASNRARRLRRYLGELDPAANAQRIAGLVRRLAHDRAGTLLPFDSFKAAIERVHYGFVLTAHPTFSLKVELQRHLLALAEAGDAVPEDAVAALAKGEHRPDGDLSLHYEHARSVEALRNLQAAVEQARAITIDVAAELYPKEWESLAPRLVTLASWVGYDTDGRSDIPWTTTFAKRLRLKLEQLERYRAQVLAIRRDAEDTALASVLELIEARLSLAIRSATEEVGIFEAPAAAGRVSYADLARISRSMVEGGAARLVQPGQLVELVDRALRQATTPMLRRRLVALRAELISQGFAAAASHLRINSLQLHNAIRKRIGLDHPPDDPSYRRSYVQAVVDLIQTVEPVAINFGAVHDERATARRAFMTMAQMLKYVDAGEPIRFLIAECETAFTLLTALYFAKLFGIDGRIDISPLFETSNALERGAQIVEEALAVPAYRDYVRKRGRLCIQTGYSDAGRYLGQLAAAAAIERVRLGLVKVMEEAGLDAVELIVFDTHGESIGRGGHPQSLADRLLYFDTPESRRRFAKADIELRQESSFQGGDGYLYFLSASSALAVLTRVLEHFLEPKREPADPFYENVAYFDEFVAAIEQFNNRVIADPAYAALLTAFGTNLLFPAGSRSTKRQFDSGSVGHTIQHPSQIRAIPHNSILQQIGILANTIGGLGQAVGKNPERFQDLYRESSRFRRLMMMVEHAFMFTDLQVVRAYLDLFDPAFWLRAAAAVREAGPREELVKAAQHVERLALDVRLRSILRVFERDHLDLAAALRLHRRSTRSSGDEPIAVDAETRDTMHILHALRIALIQRTVRRAVHIPDFSDRHAVTHADLVEAVIQLDVEPAMRLLAEVFPLVEGEDANLDYGEPTTYAEGGAHSYAIEHSTIFRPITDDYDRIRRISNALIYHMGATG